MGTSGSSIVDVMVLLDQVVGVEHQEVLVFWATEWKCRDQVEHQEVQGQSGTSGSAGSSGDIREVLQGHQV
jgi:hypothetical protein